MSLDRQRRFTDGDTFLSRSSTATLSGKTLHLSTDREGLTLTLEETAALTDFLQDQSSYPIVSERLARIKQYIATGGTSELAFYQLLTEISLPFLPQEILQQVQDILGILANKRGEANE